jgi:hypothetical protein
MFCWAAANCALAASTDAWSAAIWSADAGPDVVPGRVVVVGVVVLEPDVELVLSWPTAVTTWFRAVDKLATAADRACSSLSALASSAEALSINVVQSVTSVALGGVDVGDVLLAADEDGGGVGWSVDDSAGGGFLAMLVKPATTAGHVAANCLSAADTSVRSASTCCCVCRTAFWSVAKPFNRAVSFDDAAEEDDDEPAADGVVVWLAGTVVWLVWSDASLAWAAATDDWSELTVLAMLVVFSVASVSPTLTD